MRVVFPALLIAGCYFFMSSVIANSDRSGISRNKSSEHCPAKENDKIYIKNMSSITLFSGKMAVWKGHKLYLVSSLHSKEDRMYVQKKDLGKCLAELIYMQEKVIGTSNKAVHRRIWKCRICSRIFHTKFDLVRHYEMCHSDES